MFRRLYATSSTLPDALSARANSTPLAVRLRRSQKPAQDATQDGITQSEQTRYKRLEALGQLQKDKHGNPISVERWTQRAHNHRSRIRGLRTVTKRYIDTTTNKLVSIPETRVVGTPIYLPNITFSLIRNKTPAGEPYNPYEATFHIPISLTKADIRSYLLSAYGVKTTYIRTDIIRSVAEYRRTPRPSGQRNVGRRAGDASHKRAVVGLVDPFYYPHRIEDMSKEERELRTRWINENYEIEDNRLLNQLSRTRILKGVSLPRMLKEHGALSKFLEAGKTVTLEKDSRLRILQRVAEQRMAREKRAQDMVSEWKNRRDNKQRIGLPTPKQVKQ